MMMSEDDGGEQNSSGPSSSGAGAAAGGSESSGNALLGEALSLLAISDPTESEVGVSEEDDALVFGGFSIDDDEEEAAGAGAGAGAGGASGVESGEGVVVTGAPSAASGGLVESEVLLDPLRAATATATAPPTGKEKEESSEMIPASSSSSVPATDHPLQEDYISAPANSNQTPMAPPQRPSPGIGPNASNPLSQVSNPSSMAQPSSASFGQALASFAHRAATTIQDAVDRSTMSSAQSYPTPHLPNSLPPPPIPSAASALSAPPTAAPSPLMPTPNTPTTQTAGLGLFEGMDNAKKARLITSAIGDLLPGERVIMFLSHLSNVRDSSSPNSGIGSSFALQYGHNPTNAPATPDIVWCCCMTFYRVAIFSFRHLDFHDLSTDTTDPNSTQSNSQQTNTKPINYHDITQLIATASLSRQYQLADDEAHRRNTYHQVIQIPLASIDRVEKSSEYLAAPAIGSGMASIGGVSGIVATAVSNATSSSSSHQTHSVVGPTPGPSPTLASGSAHLGLVIYGKDNGRSIRFTTSSYGDAIRAHEALNTYAFPGRRNLGYLFAFESRRAEVMASMKSVKNNNTHNTDNNNNRLNTAGGPRQLSPQQQQQQQQVTCRATPRRYDPMVEFERQGILRPRNFSVGTGLKTVPSPWSIMAKANGTYNLCPSYPSIMVGPRSVDDQHPDGLRLVRKVASFRSEGRMPSLTWGSSIDGASIWRASQPRVGLQGNRSSADERYLRLVLECAASANASAMDGNNKGPHNSKPSISFLRMLTGGINDSELLMTPSSSGQASSSSLPVHRGANGGNVGGNNNPCLLKILDLRPRSSAMANRTGGYGYENTSYYTNATIQFCGIGNIHAVRDAYHKLSTLCNNPAANDVQWAQLVEDTKWLQQIRLILSASWQTAFHVRYNRLPVLLHCSHGWDRTSQVAALAQIMLDPYYRTRAGFSALIEKDFMAFGHPFHTRAGHGEGRGERGGGGGGGGGSSSGGSGSSGGGGGDEGQLSPIFIQFLDAVYQIVRQFPDYFEFNTRYLLMLSEHIYSCRFGTLLCDNERERETVAGIRQRTHCLWEYLDSIPDVVNTTFYNNNNINNNNGIVSDTENNDDDDACTEVRGSLIMPLPILLRNVTLWAERHCMHGPKPTLRCFAPDLHQYVRATTTTMDTTEEGNGSGSGRSNPYQLHQSYNDFEVALVRKAIDEASKWKAIAEERGNKLKELEEEKEKKLME